MVCVYKRKLDVFIMSTLNGLKKHCAVDGGREMWHLLSKAWGLLWRDSLRSKPTNTWEEHCDGVICAIANPEHCV